MAAEKWCIEHRSRTHSVWAAPGSVPPQWADGVPPKDPAGTAASLSPLRVVDAGTQPDAGSRPLLERDGRPSVACGRYVFAE